VPLLLVVATLAVQDTTTTTAVPRVAGDPLPPWVAIAVIIGVLVFIIGGGLLVNQRTGRPR
jgi:hypothetical protein